MTQPTLHTDRLILRPFDLSDAPDVQRLAGDYAVANTTLNIPHPYEDGMAEQWIATHKPEFEKGESVTFAITLHSQPALVGAIDLIINPRFKRAELGYWIGVPYWNQGYCTEAAAALVHFAFETLRLHKITAHHQTRNPASGRVMQKLGMQKEGTLKEHVLKWERFEDIECYGLLASD